MIGEQEFKHLNITSIHNPSMVHSEETKRKISETRIKRIKEGKISSWNRGMDSRKEFACPECKSIFKKHIPKNRPPKIGPFCGHSCRTSYTNRIYKPIQNKGNMNAFKYGSYTFSNRRAIEMFGKRCKLCGDERSKIEVHHRDGNRKNNPLDGSNWIVLCRSCHAKHHMGEKLVRL